MIGFGTNWRQYTHPKKINICVLYHFKHTTSLDDSLQIKKLLDFECIEYRVNLGLHAIQNRFPIIYNLCLPVFPLSRNGSVEDIFCLIGEECSYLDSIIRWLTKTSSRISASGHVAYLPASGHPEAV